jgi:hypothetical protein
MEAARAGHCTLGELNIVAGKTVGELKQRKSLQHRRRDREG